MKPHERQPLRLHIAARDAMPPVLSDGGLPRDPLTQFLRWFLAQPLMGLAPAGIYDYGPVRSLVLILEPPFQVELFTVKPGFGFAKEHRHPNVDTYEVHVWGEIVLTRNGQLVEPITISGPHGGELYVTRIRETDWHGAKPMASGGAFLSVQEWLHGTKPASVGLDWEGAPPSREHAVHLVKQRRQARLSQRNRRA